MERRTNADLAETPANEAERLLANAKRAVRQVRADVANLKEARVRCEIMALPLSSCGVQSEMCVAATARAAMQRDLVVVLPQDAHGTYLIQADTGGGVAVPPRRSPE